MPTTTPDDSTRTIRHRLLAASRPLATIGVESRVGAQPHVPKDRQRS